MGEQSERGEIPTDAAAVPSHEKPLTDLRDSAPRAEHAARGGQSDTTQSEVPQPRQTSDALPNADARQLTEPRAGAAPAAEQAASEPSSKEATPSPKPGSDIAIPVSTTGTHAAVSGGDGVTQTQSRRPPVLASEALLRDIAPSRPARWALRVWCPLLGVLGTTAAWIVTQGEDLGWLLGGAFAALALLGIPPMPYQGRAAAVTTISGTGLLLLLGTDTSRSSADEAGAGRAMLTVSVILLSSGLLFRAWHRASRLSRAMVASGVCLAWLYLWLSGDLRNLTLVDIEWQSWLPRVAELGFGLLLLLSLLAFMDARSTGGAAVWATSILCWNALYAVITVVRESWPKQSEGFDISRMETNVLLARLSAPLLTALISIGLAQLMAAWFAGSVPRPRSYHWRRPRHTLREFSTLPPRPHSH